MHFPLAIAVLALLAFALLPFLDHSANSKLDAKDLRSYLIRIARWVDE